jgi:hypothetical protein
MTISLPTVQQDYESYDKQIEINNAKAEELLGQLFPELKLPREDIFNILSFLQETKVNAQILPKVIRGVYNLTIGTGKGQVIIYVKGETVNVQTRETDEDIHL